MQFISVAGAVALAFGLATGPASAAAPTSYHLVDLGPNTTAYAINGTGQVAGQHRGAARWNGSRWIDEPDMGHGSLAWAIDPKDNMAGHETDAFKNVHLMYYPRKGQPLEAALPGTATTLDPRSPSGGLSANGKFGVGTFLVKHQPHCLTFEAGGTTSIDLGLPAGMRQCFAVGVNDDGVVSGWVEDAGGAGTGFTWSNGTFTLVPPIQQSGLTQINGLGHAAGSIDGANAAFWDGNTLHDISTDGTLHMDGGEAINIHDDIVGPGEDPALPRGMDALILYSGGALVDVVTRIDDRDGWAYYKACAINDAGWIAGYGNHFDNGVPVQHAFILVPD